MSAELLVGDCRKLLRRLPRASVDCCVTSPPYYGLRDYDADGQLGLEETAGEFIANLVSVGRGIGRVLKDKGTWWLNLGDSYASSAGGGFRGGPPSPSSTLAGNGHVGGGPKLAKLAKCSRRGRSGNLGNGGINGRAIPDDRVGPHGNAKNKDLLGIPWRVALALQADGWFLRQDIIWAKPNPMPESVTDRCTKSHEYLFLLSKRPRYYFDADAIAEPLAAQDCYDMLVAEGLEPPDSYARGKPNANCDGCVKVTSPTYWNFTRIDRPEVFRSRAEQSRRLGARLVRYQGKRIFLDELPPEAKGRPMKSLRMPDCGIFCEEGRDD